MCVVFQIPAYTYNNESFKTQDLCLCKYKLCKNQFQKDKIWSETQLLTNADRLNMTIECCYFGTIHTLSSFHGQHQVPYFPWHSASTGEWPVAD